MPGFHLLHGDVFEKMHLNCNSFHGTPQLRCANTANPKDPLTKVNADISVGFRLVLILGILAYWGTPPPPLLGVCVPPLPQKTLTLVKEINLGPLLREFLWKLNSFQELSVFIADKELDKSEKSV